MTTFRLGYQLRPWCCVVSVKDFHLFSYFRGINRQSIRNIVSKLAQHVYDLRLCGEILNEEFDTSHEIPCALISYVVVSICFWVSLYLVLEVLVWIPWSIIKMTPTYHKSTIRSCKISKWLKYKNIASTFKSFILPGQFDFWQLHVNYNAKHSFPRPLYTSNSECRMIKHLMPLPVATKLSKIKCVQSSY